MEIRIVLRGALAGFVAGVLGFVFARIFAEPLIDKAIAYENGRGKILEELNKAIGDVAEAEGPEIFSRHVQSTIGLASGIIGFATAMGALLGVAYVVLHGRFAVRPRHLAWMLAAVGLFGVYVLPFVKYPANPPAIGHDFTIATRGRLYLTLVGCSIVFLGSAIYLARYLMRRLPALASILLATVAFLVAYGVLIGLLPSLGHLADNKAHAGQFGFAPAATETPQSITNIKSAPLTIDGKTIQPGQIVYPGFDADLLWKFRWYSLLNQVLIWTVTAIAFGELLDRYLTGRPLRRAFSRNPPQPAFAG
jgi:hypothetical protein